MNRLFPLAALALAQVCALADGPVAPPVSGGEDAVVAEVNGQKLTFADLQRKHPGALFTAQDSFYEARKKAVEAFADEILLQQQARKENLTVGQLLDRHVNDAVAQDPSEEALRVYYEGVDTTQPYEAVRGQIVAALRQRRLAKARAAYLASLRSQAVVRLRLQPPRAEISLQGTAVRGPAGARVTVVEYADYECPYCQQAQPALEKLEAEFKGRLAFAYKDYPLPMHAEAQKAAEATHCADAGGKYWAYHDLLFANKQLDVPALKGYARQLGLDGSSFDRCLDTGAKSAEVQTQAAEAQWLGIEGTPAIFINGRFFSGALTYDALRAIVEEELGKGSSPQVAQR